MAQTLIRTDDIDGSTPAARVRFSINDDKYVIDLSDENKARMVLALMPFIEKALADDETPLAYQVRGRRRLQRARVDPEQLSAIREWARKNNYHVADRGRVAKQVMDAYQVAHQPIAS